MDTVESKEIVDKNISTDHIREREFYDCTFINCQFADFPDVKFYNCKFITCNLSNSNLHESQIRNCIFQESKLLGIGISRNNFAFSANFFSCDLRYAEFLELHLRGMKIENCNCQGTRFSSCDLRNASLINSNFNEAIFNRCDLQGTKFKENKYLIINPAANKIKRTEIGMETAINIATVFGFKVE